jgi:hypothetical protein
LSILSFSPKENLLKRQSDIVVKKTAKQRSRKRRKGKAEANLTREKQKQR